MDDPHTQGGFSPIVEENQGRTPGNRLSYFFPPLTLTQHQDGFHPRTPHVDDLPFINLQASRKQAFSFRADGGAVWNNKIFVRARHRLEEGRHLPDRVHIAIEKHKYQKKVQADFQGLVDQIVHGQNSLPGVGSKVVARLKQPFLGHRADGIVKYVGPVPEVGTGLFLGIELMEAIGQHDGMGYFASRKGLMSLHHGTFVRGDQIEWAENCNATMRKEYGIGRLVLDNPRFSSRRWWGDPFSPAVSSIRRFHASGAQTHR